VANITTTQVDDGLATIIAARALGYLKSNTVLARLVARDWDSDVASYGQSVKIPFTGSLSVNDKSAGSVVTLQQPADSNVTITLNKHKEVSFLIEDIARFLARPDYQAQYIADGMAKVAEQIDGDIAALYSGLSQTIDATAGLNESHFRQARKLLNTAKAPLSQRYAVLHEDAEYEFLGIEKAVNGDYAATLGQAAAAAMAGRFMGFDVLLDQNIKTSTSQKNLFLHRNAFALATRPLAAAPAGMGVIQKTMDEDGMGLRVTLSYSADYLGVQVTIDVLYGVAELRDAFGVVVSTTDL
jgi:hypothetical protein